jgi:hypothetical protein
MCNSSLRRLIAASTILGLVGLSALPAQAQISLAFEPVSIFGAPGDSLDFLLTMSNNSSLAIENITPAFTFAGPINWDDSEFVNNLPLTLNANTSYARNVFASIQGDATPGLFTGTYVVDATVVGSGDFVSASANISITVIGAESSAPEPTTMSLLGLGMGGFTLLRLRRSRNNSSNRERR